MRSIVIFAFLLRLCIAGVPSVGNWDVFSTKTLYRWAFDGHRSSAVIPLPNENDENLISVNNRLCRAAHINMVIRHGARYPSGGSTEDIRNLVERLKASNNPLVTNWVSPYKDELASKLNQEGENEQKTLGERTFTRFKRLFDKNGQYVKFISSEKQRTKASANAFFNGVYKTTGDCLYGESPCINTTAVSKMAPQELLLNNSILRFYDECDNYAKMVDDNETHFAEFTKFEKTEAFVNIRKSMKTKLGLPDNFTLSGDDVYLLYELCAYDQYTLHPATPPFWCDLLTDAEREVLEYGQDLEKWYEGMYGHPINAKMPCTLVRHMFAAIDAAKNASWDYERPFEPDAAELGYTAGHFHFAHSETLATLMTSLGLYNDTESFLASNRVTMQNRKLRTSHVLPFSANLAFVLYACNTNPNDVSIKRDFVLKLFVNEQFVRIPGCDADACPYDVVRQRYGDLIDKCDMAAICTPDKDDDDDDDDVNCAHYVNMNIVWLFLVFVFQSVLF